MSIIEKTIGKQKSEIDLLTRQSNKLNDTEGARLMAVKHMKSAVAETLSLLDRLTGGWIESNPKIKAELARTELDLRDQARTFNERVA